MYIPRLLEASEDGTLDGLKAGTLSPKKLRRGRAPSDWLIASTVRRKNCLECRGYFGGRDSTSKWEWFGEVTTVRGDWKGLYTSSTELLHVDRDATDASGQVRCIVSPLLEYTERATISIELDNL